MIIPIDFETYYAKDYSLSKMTTEAYIRDPRFETIGVSARVDDNDELVWVTGDEVGPFLRSLNLEQHYILAHNAVFDGAILSWRYGIKPKGIIDTLSMARPLQNSIGKLSLANLAKHFQLGEKGTEVIQAMGKRLADFTEPELAQYGEYCKNDVRLTYDLYHKLRPYSTPQEMYIIDMMMRAYTDPVLVLDKPLLQSHLAQVQARKIKLLAKLDVENGRDKLMSNPQFAALLQELGVDPPTKVSAKTGKETWAFSKTDEDFKALLEHEDEKVQTLVAARLGVKSTLEETRTQAFIAVAERGPLPILLNYYRAHTGRASGGDGVNPQNLPRGGTLRHAMGAPVGHSLIAGDSSQIEARLLAWYAGQDDLVEDFRNDVDIYCKFAGDVYGEEVTKADKPRRFLGKTCLSGNTRVVTNRGVVRLSKVKDTDLLWDGQSWVNHAGLLDMGVKEVETFSGVTATSDHAILTVHGWREWSEVQTSPTLFQLALCSGSLPSLGTNGTSPRRGRVGVTRPSAGVLAGMRVQSMPTTCAADAVPDATNVLRSQQQLSGIGATRAYWPTTSTERGYLTDWLQQSRGVIRQLTERTTIMVGGALESVTSGVMTALRSFGTPLLFRGGTTHHSTWTGSTTTMGTGQGTFDSAQKAPTPQIRGKYATSNPASKNLKQRLRVYDLVNAGPNHRFTILSDAGPLVVHNCILGLGYGTGADKLRKTLALGKDAVILNTQQAQQVVTLYRNKYAAIPYLWKQADKAIEAMAGGYEFELGERLPLHCSMEGVRLPNGMLLRYPDLRKTTDGYVYSSLRGPINLYGAKLVENVVQALARIVVFTQTCKLDQWLRKQDTEQQRFKIVHSVHDEAVAVAPTAHTEAVVTKMTMFMSTAPSWCVSLPVACEVRSGATYGGCK